MPNKTLFVFIDDLLCAGLVAKQFPKESIDKMEFEDLALKSSTTLMSEGKVTCFDVSPELENLKEIRSQMNHAILLDDKEWETVGLSDALQSNDESLVQLYFSAILGHLLESTKAISPVTKVFVAIPYFRKDQKKLLEQTAKHFCIAASLHEVSIFDAHLCNVFGMAKATPKSHTFGSGCIWKEDFTCNVFQQVGEVEFNTWYESNDDNVLHQQVKAPSSENWIPGTKKKKLTSVDNIKSFNSIFIPPEKEQAKVDQYMIFGGRSLWPELARKVDEAYGDRLSALTPVGGNENGRADLEESNRFVQGLQNIFNGIMELREKQQSSDNGEASIAKFDESERNKYIPVELNVQDSAEKEWDVALFYNIQSQRFIFDRKVPKESEFQINLCLPLLKYEGDKVLLFERIPNPFGRILFRISSGSKSMLIKQVNDESDELKDSTRIVYRENRVYELLLSEEHQVELDTRERLGTFIENQIYSFGSQESFRLS